MHALYSAHSTKHSTCMKCIYIIDPVTTAMYLYVCIERFKGIPCKYKCILYYKVLNTCIRYTVMYKYIVQHCIVYSVHCTVVHHKYSAVAHSLFLSN